MGHLPSGRSWSWLYEPTTVRGGVTPPTWGVLMGKSQNTGRGYGVSVSPPGAGVAVLVRNDEGPPVKSARRVRQPFSPTMPEELTNFRKKKGKSPDYHGPSTRRSTHRPARPDQPSPGLTPTTRGRLRASSQARTGSFPAHPTASSTWSPLNSPIGIFSTPTSTTGRLSPSSSSRSGGAWNSHCTAGGPN